MTIEARGAEEQSGPDRLTDEGWVSLVQLVPRALMELDRQHPAIVSRLRAPAQQIRKGSFDMSAVISRFGESTDLLVLDGLLFAELDAGRARAGWLLGADDLVRPSEFDAGLTRKTTWRALQPTQVAVLDAEFARRAGPVPGVMSELLWRAHRTSHWLLTKLLLLGSPSVEERLMLLFALLGERWGRVRSGGVHLDLQLTHALLSALVGARRPTVTVALKALHNRGVVRRDVQGGWWLRPGEAPNRLTSWPDYAEALGFR